MASAKDVALFFLNRGNDDECAGVSNLKLQKLVYYAQGFHLAIYDTEFFPESIEAWTHGPVCPDVYHEYKGFGSGIIVCNESQDANAVFTPEQIELLNEVYEVYGQFSAWKLRNMTHEETPWKNNEAFAREITKPEMLSFFKGRIN